MEVKDRIKQLRKIKNLTLKELSEQIKISFGNISDWERGRSKPSADALVALADYFNVSTDWLLTGKGKGPEESDKEEKEQKRKESDMIFSVAVEAPGDDIPINEDKYITSVQLKRALRDYILQMSGRVNRESDQEENIIKEENVIQLAKRLENYIDNYVDQPLTSDRKKELIDSLSDDEIYLLLNYRKLSDKQKGKIEGIIETMLDYNKKIMSSTYTSGEESVADESSNTA